MFKLKLKKGNSYMIPFTIYEDAAHTSPKNLNDFDKIRCCVGKYTSDDSGVVFTRNYTKATPEVPPEFDLYDPINGKGYVIFTSDNTEGVTVQAFNDHEDNFYYLDITTLEGDQEKTPIEAQIQFVNVMSRFT